MRLALVGLLCAALGASAQADTITVGVFAPSAPFPSTAAKVELASKLGDAIGAALGEKAVGRVYARAGDFGAAVKKGDVTIALVDATYLASASGYTVIAGSVRGGDTTQAWQLVAKGASKLTDLRGKRVLVPANGGRETEFVLNVLLGGLEKTFFGKIEAAADTASALSALGLGKADAAVVPVGVDLPAGATAVLTLPGLATPVLVTYGTLTAAQRSAIAAAVTGFRGDATIGGFRAVDGDGVRAIARRFGVPVKRGPFVTPSVRLLVGDLVEGRKPLVIERTPVAQFAEAP